MNAETHVKVKRLKISTLTFVVCARLCVVLVCVSE